MNTAPVCRLLVLCGLLFCSSLCVAQSPALQRIRVLVQQINADSALNTIELDAEDCGQGNLDGGGSVTGYFKRKELVKVVEWLGVSGGNRKREFYLASGQLIFVYEQFDLFARSSEGIDHSRYDTTYRARFYFSKGQLISKKKEGTVPAAFSTPDSVKEMKATLGVYSQLLSGEMKKWKK